MKQQRINELNKLYSLPTGKVYKVKRNTLKSILKRLILHPLTVALTVYLLIILSTIILTLKLY
jgi:hypothetical protein